MRVLLTGGNGMVGKAILRLAPTLSPDWQITAPRSAVLDLCDAAAVQTFFSNRSFDLVIHAAAKVGGIQANIADPVGFYVDNTLMNTHLIEAARENSVERFLFLGSSCMYPRDFGQALKEEHILAAPLEPTNEGYALAKVTGARHCAYISTQYGLAYKTFIPCNLYGPGDHFEPHRSHLLAAVIAKMHEAVQSSVKSVEIWGDGTARREFMYVDELAAFILTSQDRFADMPDYLNIGIDDDYTVNEYYQAAADVMGYQGGFHHKLDAPVGMMRKLMSSEKARAFGWNPQTTLASGIQKTYDYFLTQHKQAA